MKNLKDVENLMLLPARQANPDYAKAFGNMLLTVGFLDELDRFGRLKLINVLYNVNKRRFTYVRIAADFHISDNALRRHREFFAQCFYYYLNISRLSLPLAV